MYTSCMRSRVAKQPPQFQNIRELDRRAVLDFFLSFYLLALLTVDVGMSTPLSTSTVNNGIVTRNVRNLCMLRECPMTTVLI